MRTIKLKGSRKLFIGFFSFFTWMCMNMPFAYALGLNMIKPSVVSKIRAFQEELGVLINGLMAFFLVSSIFIMVIHFIRLGYVSDKPVLRVSVKHDLMITAVCTGIIGSAWTIYGLLVAIAFG